MAFVGRLLEELSNTPDGGIGSQRSPLGALGPMSRVPYPSPRLPPRDPPATPQCPPPWRAVWDQQYGRFFYINELSGQRQWDYPLVSPGYGFESRQFYSSPSPPASISSRSNSVSSSYRRTPPLAPPASYDHSLMMQKAASSVYPKQTLGGSRRPTPPPSHNSGNAGGTSASQAPQFQFVYQDGRGGYLSPESLERKASGKSRQKQQQQQQKQPQNQSQQRQQTMSRSPSAQSWTDSVLGNVGTPESLLLTHDGYDFSDSFDQSGYAQQKPNLSHHFEGCDHDGISLDGFETMDCTNYHDNNSLKPQQESYNNSRHFAADFSMPVGLF